MAEKQTTVERIDHPAAAGPAADPGPPGAASRAIRGMRRTIFSDRAARWASLLTLILLWQLAGTLGTRVPGPVESFSFIADEWGRAYGTDEWSVYNNELVRNVLETVRRTFIAIPLLLVVGIAIGYAMGRWWRVQAYFNDMVVVGLTMPGLIWALLAIMWFGFGFRAPVFVAFILPLPGMIVNTLQGSLSVPRELRDMSEVYGVSFRRQFRHLVMPAMAGHVVAGARLAILGGVGGVMLVEWFGNNVGTGYRARFWYDAQQFDGLMSWGLVIIILVILIDRGFMNPIDKAVHKWRREVGEFGSGAGKQAG